MNLFTFVKQSLSILDVVQDFVPLKKGGQYWKGTCPFHAERTASFTISPHKEIFYCFGCHAGGDLISFIGKLEHCSPLEAAHYLIERYGLNVPQDLISDKSLGEAEVNEKKRYWALCKLVADWAHLNLKKSPAARAYFTDRKFNAASLDQFYLGYFPGGLHAVQNLVDFCRKENFLIQDLVTAGIIIQGKKVLYSPFEERMLFPIKDMYGNFCGFGGRIYKKDDERPKYYNSRENPFFVKGNLLFGLDRAKQAIQETGAVFLCEGYTDCISMVQYAHENTIATLGTACTQEHLKQLARYAQIVFVIYDGDTAGQQATLRLAQLCWQVDLELKVITLPSGYDPASYLLEYKTIQSLIKNTQDIFEFYIATLGKNFSQQNLQQKVTHIRKLIEIVGNIKDALKQDILLQKAAATFDIPFSSLKNELSNVNKPQESPASTSDIPKNIKKYEALPKNNSLTEIPDLEKKLFSVIINNIEKITHEQKQYLYEYLSFPLKDMLQKFIELKKEQPDSCLTHFFALLTEAEKQLVSHIIIEYQEYGNETFENMFSLFQKLYWKTFINDAKQALMHAKKMGDTAQVETILQRVQTLKEQLRKRGLI